MMKKTVGAIMFASSLLAEDVMVERMQSVVDEVTELRSRYESSARNHEACQRQVREQAKIIDEASRSEGLDYKVFEENKKRLERLEADNSALKKRLEAREEEQKSKESIGLQEELAALLKENTRLQTAAKALEEKNRVMQDRLNTQKASKNSKEELSDLKRELQAVQDMLKSSQETNRDLKQQIKKISAQTGQSKGQNPLEEESQALLADENRRLEHELELLKTKTASLEMKCMPKTKATLKKAAKTEASKRVCTDENPFPKLMMKEQKAVSQPAPEKRSIDKEEVPNSLEKSMDEDAQEVILDKGRTYRLKQESAIYRAPNADVIAVWEEKTSFTSNVYKGEWIKITGHFVNMKWTRLSEEMWVKGKDTVKR